MDTAYCINIGICGKSGSGKSSLINGFLFKDNEDEGAAQVDS